MPEPTPAPDPAGGPDGGRPDPSAPPVEDPRVTVVVASMNRRDELLASLGRHRAPVVLVDNGSSDGTVDAVRAAHPHVEVVPLPANRGAAARTVGVRRARTPYVAFADDDSWWAPGSLRTAADALDANPTVAVVQASVLVGPQERPDPFDEVLAGSPLGARTAPLPGPRVLGFVACAVAVRRDAFLAVGGFDDVVRFPGEEERVAWDLTSAGWDLVHLPAAVVHHHPSPRRHSPARRVRAITRSAVLTGVLRLPARAAAARVARALVGAGASGATRLGVLDAVRDLPRAVRGRRVTTPDVLRDLAVLTGRPDDDARPTAPASRPAPSNGGDAA
ncbi:glycosyltransferase family 2 protein [Cellulomonas carbonis]|nr:glycosyltransferase [Cellulomonas carbonis]GGC17231.1 glycosyl transferase [Cellulomonas carbonis]